VLLVGRNCASVFEMEMGSVLLKLGVSRFCAQWVVFT
jgi:hypothetical protein